MLLGVLSMPAGGLAFAAIGTSPWAAALAVAHAINWFGDSLDGTLAWVRDQPWPRYGCSAGGRSGPTWSPWR